jgi:tetratricopeptide (TPR) repeat protein
MKQLILIVMLLIISISCYAQESQESYTLLLLDFEDRTGIQNPLLAMFNDTMAFVLSRQTGPVQVRMVPTSDRNALLARAATMKPDATLPEQGLLAAEWIDADALVAGSYAKQGEQWSLESQVYHRREGSKTRQEIQIQGDNFYKLLDDFPAQLLQQFAASYAALTTDSWKAYEEYRQGHKAFDSYNFFLALEHYEKALKLDPTLALAYAEQSYVYFMRGQAEQATKAIETAKQWLPKASPMEQLAIRILDYAWDTEKHSELVGYNAVPEAGNMAPGGVWDEILIHRLTADIYKEEGKQAEADQHHQQWFEAIQRRIRAHPEDASLLHSTAKRCLNIKRYVDEAIDMELKAVELNLWEGSSGGPREALSSLYAHKGDMEQALEWAKRSIQRVPGADGYPTYSYRERWYDLATWLRKEKIPPERLLRWCQDVLRIPELYPPHRLHAQYLIAEIYEFMNDTAKADAILASLGAPRESDWIVIGAFDAPMEDPFPDTPPFELLTDLTATYMGIMDKEIQWEQWEDDQPMDGILRISIVFHKKYWPTVPATDPYVSLDIKSPSVAYSCIYVEVPMGMEVQARTGAGRIRIWLNDNPSPVIEGNSARVAVPDSQVDDVSLKAGLNRFLVATAFGTAAFDLTFRITDHDGNAIPGLRYISAKEVLASH